uniref:ANAPC4_WD40 domain-containing protein n=1 Tax=Syphacia muris TaxID=451379 RepID=A0A0N5ACY5_9BILA
MKLKFKKIIVPEQDGAEKVVALNWTANGRKIAVVISDRNIQLFDENGTRRDKFATKPMDSKVGEVFEH